MSYEEFRKRIDTARQILVGAVPSPAGQIDQITYALIYKFMNDIDDQSAALGGKRAYFTGDYEKYNWHNLMTPSLEAHDRLELYRQAIQSMSKNPGLPKLFRDIYQNAFLPFNSPSVLSLFLSEMNKFQHGSSDDIGDAYEYLLSITGAQGDVGQFRTPRHIIDFIVKAVNPTKTDKVLDPAVGTAGFLISAYNHVKSQHDGKDEQGNANSEKRLTADELDKIHHNYRGFDIDPNMVRTASVNMYLHSFTQPDIRNHDSLSSEDYWDEWYDVILANPPFMTPKGGIQPHKKFGVKANRAEVLFVDYIASHLKPNGRAGIVVPEGIIFQSGNAYKDLRKNLVENYLYAVVSLPAGVFNPYAGVKTSILLLDKQLAKERDDILFVKIENDGFSLNAQRRPINGSQLFVASHLLNKYREIPEINLEEVLYEYRESLDTPLSPFDMEANLDTHLVRRKTIAESGDYNLSADRYKTLDMGQAEYPTIKLSDVFEQIKNGKNVKQIDDTGKYKVSRIQTIAKGVVDLNATKWTNDEVKEDDFLKEGDILLSHINSYEHLAKTALFKHDSKVVHGANLLRLRPNKNLIIPEYASFCLKSELFIEQARMFAQRAVNQASINSTSIKNLEIPLPPIEIQRQIVAELDGYQKIIDAAQTIVKTYKPTVKIDPEWKTKKLGDILLSKPAYGSGASKVGFDGKNRYVRITDITDEGVLKSTDKASPSEVESKYFLESNDLLIARSGSVGRTYLHSIDEDINYQWAGYLINFRIDSKLALPSYVYYITKSKLWRDWIYRNSKTGTLTNINAQQYSSFEIPIPPIEIQRQIVAKLEAEQKLVGANKQLIETFQQKIKDKIAEVWGE